MTREHPQHADPVTYLGIDVGTSATKAVVIAPDGTVVARSRVPHPAARGAGPGRANPAAWKASITAAVRDLGPHTATVRGVGLDTHCPTALLLDSAGEPLTAGVTWDHPGLAEPTEQLIAALTPADQRLVGNHLMPATAMGAAHRLLQTIEPQAAAAAATFGFASTWLGLWLTGERAIDPTQASYTGLMASTDGSCRWLDDVLDRLGIPPQQLPPVRPSLSVLGALLPATADTLHLPHGIPVLVGSADTPAASYALGTQPGGRPLLIMGTTHVVSNALDAPDHRASALQRVDVRAGRWLINGVINGGDALAYGAQRLGYGHGDVAVEALVGVAFSAEPGQMAGAPVFIPHIRPERGPLWFAEPRTALLGAIPDTAAPSAARGVVEGVLFADRMIIESCIGEQQRTLYVSGAFGFEPQMPQLLSDALERDILVVDESHLPAIGAAAMCSEVLDGQTVAPPPARRVQPRPQWRDTITQRWQEYRQVWSSVTNTPPLSTLDEATATTASRAEAGTAAENRYQECPYMTTPQTPTRSATTKENMTATSTGLIYVSRLLTDRAMEHLHSLGAPVRVGREAPPSSAELQAGIAGASAAVVTLTERVDADLLAAAGDQLKVIANVAVGFDNIDLDAAAAAGVTVTNTPGVLDRATADHTFALILAATRRIAEGDRFLRSRQPWVWGPRMLVGLDISAGATLGILGYGRIGEAVARRAQAFDMTVVATSLDREAGTVENGVTFVDTPTLLADSDVISVHTPLTPQTHHLIDAAALRAMKPTAYLINTARGGVVDETALIKALHTGQIRGAALDVFEGEPDVNPALLNVPGLVLTPHTASAGEATRDAMGILALDNAAAVLAGKPPLTPVR